MGQNFGESGGDGRAKLSVSGNRHYLLRYSTLVGDVAKGD